MIPWARDWCTEGIKPGGRVPALWIALFSPAAFAWFSTSEPKK